jgi:peptidoglycan hydrolase-like protein with peptidoglycan-binding domain
LLDKQLIYAGFTKYYKSGPGPYFGTSTANAVKAFLLKHKELWTGNEPDSIVGPKTWEAIFKAKK